MSFEAGADNTAAAISKMTEMLAEGDRSDAQKIGILFVSRTTNTFGLSDTVEAVAAARLAGVELYVVGETEG